MHRTHTCGELTASHINQTVTLCAWVNKIRNLGGMVFIDLRDRYGITQVTLDPAIVGQVLVDSTADIKQEYVLKITGKVVARPDTMINPDMTTGQIEIVASSLEVITKAGILPFAIADDPKTSEEVRMKYRYLDLRRQQIKDNVIFRAQMNHFTRNRFTDKGFLEVQTPIFTVSSPEGARDYLIPSRVNPGQFYALPQAPQQYKQLLMVGGIDKYFQIAPCFRDEDPRADRHSCEFYQVDCEMSFVGKEDVYSVVQSYITDLIPALVAQKSITVAFERLSYNDAVERYGSDKPDLRFDCHFHNLTDRSKQSGLSFLADAPCVKGFVLPGHQVTRKQVDELTHIASLGAAKGLAYLICSEGTWSGSIASKLSDESKHTLQTQMNVQSGDTVFIIADHIGVVHKSLDKVRNACRDMFNLVQANTLGFVWIEDFPFFEEDENSPSGLEFAHNPFSFIQGGMETVTTKKAMERQTTQYDLTCNGYEILSGSIRNHDPEVLVKAFEAAGYGIDEIKKRFGTMYEAFQFGPPPHGGFAIGFDRLMMILRDEENIRECYAFPKSGRAQDVMMGAPSMIDEKELKVIGIKIQE